MPAITKAERELKKKVYDAAIHQLYLKIGWDELTYGRVAKELGIRKSTLQAYYPTKAAIFETFRRQYKSAFFEELVFSSRHDFLQSWTGLLNNQFQSKLTRYGFSNAMNGSETIQQGIWPVFDEILSQLLNSMSRSEAEETLTIAIGMATMKFINYKPFEG